MKRVRKEKLCMIKYYMVCLICAFAVVLAGNTVSVSAKTVTTSVTVGKGKTYDIEQNLSSKAKYKISNKQIATAKNGKITAKKVGKTTITIKDKGNTYIYKVTVSKVYLSKQSVSVNKGKTTTLRVKGTSRKAKWTSSNKSVATVKNGKITAKKVGKTTITVKVDGIILKCKVKVENPKLNKSKLKIEAGKTTLLQVKGTASDVKWTSSNNGVATVKNGKITAKKAGTTVIGAKVNGTTLKCKVTVTAKIKDVEESQGNTESTETSEIPDVPQKPENTDTETPEIPEIPENTEENEETVAPCYLDTMAITWGFEDNGSKTIVLKNCIENGISSVTWSSSDTDIVKVIDGNYLGACTLYKGCRGGVATITAVADGVTYTCKVTSFCLSEPVYTYEEGTRFDYETHILGEEEFCGVGLNWTWDRTDLIQKKIWNGTQTNYLVEGSGVTTIAGVSTDGYTKVVVKVTTVGTYIDKKGTYNEQLTNEVYELLKSENTRNTDRNSSCYSMPSDQLEFLLATADRWYNGEITKRTTQNLMDYTPFENAANYITPYGERGYFVGGGCTTIKLEQANTVNEIVNGINTYMGYPNGNIEGWSWLRNLLYIKIHMEGNTAYIYMIP